jgi:CcmD family protein
MPPENGGYMVAAYIVTTVVLVGYALWLIRRANRALKRLD